MPLAQVCADLIEIYCMSIWCPVCLYSSYEWTPSACQLDPELKLFQSYAEMGTWTRDAHRSPLQCDRRHGNVGFYFLYTVCVCNYSVPGTISPFLATAARFKRSASTSQSVDPPVTSQINSNMSPLMVYHVQRLIYQKSVWYNIIYSNLKGQFTPKSELHIVSSSL